MRKSSLRATPPAILKLAASSEKSVFCAACAACVL
jgi:hypothetical protein